MALIVELDVGDFVMIGDAKVTAEEKKGRKRVRIRIEAPRSTKIERNPGKQGAGVPHPTLVRGDTHDVQQCEPTRPG